MESAPSSSHPTEPARQPDRQPLPQGLVAGIVLAAIVMTCSVCPSLSGALILWAQSSGAFYLRISPTGWNNVSLSGSPSGMQYAISQNDPGVILACGSLTQGYRDTTACWRTTG